MTQADLFDLPVLDPAPKANPVPAVEATWQQVNGLCRTHYRLIDTDGEPTFWWVRQRIAYHAYYVIAPWGVLPGEYASVAEAQAAVMAARSGVCNQAGISESAACT